MTPRLLLLVCIAALAGCAGGDSGDTEARADSVTQRQRDSIIGASRLPGARGVRGALDASDAAAARATAHDTLDGGR